MKRINNRPELYVQRSTRAGVVRATRKDLRQTSPEEKVFSLADAVPDDRFYFDFAPRTNITPSKK